MTWPIYRETVSVYDVLETGACADGVAEWLEANGRQIAGSTKEYQDNEYILKAAHGSGYGDGYGSGYGSGDGYGYGSGSGDGYGYGDGGINL